MKKTIYVLAMLAMFSCTNDDSVGNDVNSKEVISTTKTTNGNKNAKQYDATMPSISYGNYEFTRNDNGRVAVFKDKIWLYDLELSDYNFSTTGSLEESDLIFTHNNGKDQYKTTNFRLKDDVALVDFETSVGTSVKDITINNYSTFKAIPWVEVFIAVWEWLSSNTTVTEGGTKGDCSGSLSNCTNGGFMTYTVTTGWFGIQTGSKCSVTCY